MNAPDGKTPTLEEVLAMSFGARSGKLVHYTFYRHTVDQHSDADLKRIRDGFWVLNGEYNMHVHLQTINSEIDRRAADRKDAQTRKVAWLAIVIAILTPFVQKYLLGC